MRFRSAPTALAILMSTLALPASAGEGSRYAPAPPVVLSPNLAEPWILQLRPPAYRAASPAPAVAYRPNGPSVTLWRGDPEPRDRLIGINPDSDGTRVRHAALSPAPERQIAAEFLPTEVEYHGPHKAGTIVIDTSERHLYLIEPNGRARRYGVGVGRPGFQWAGEHTVTRKAEWPDWTPPDAMLKRQPNLPRHMEGGPNNPLGARALYLGSTEYRIHGSNEPWTIGHAVSSGCIRMRNEDVTDLYQRVPVGTRVIVM